MPATSWSEKEKSAADGWSSARYAGPAPTEFVLIGGVLIPAEGSSEEVQAANWSERSVSATSFTEKSRSAVAWTERT